MEKGLTGPRPSGPRPYGPQQVIIQPPKGYVPPLRNELTPIGVYDTATGYFVALPIEALVEALVLAEKQYTLDRIDDRQKATVSMQVGDAIGSSRTKAIEVPEGELWYLCGHEIIVHQAAGLTAGDLHCNFRVSSFPKTNDTEKLYYSTDRQLVATQAEIAAGDITDHKQLEAGQYWKMTNVDQTSGDVTATLETQYRKVLRDFRESDELNTELRLVAGNKLTLVVTVATAALAGAGVDVDLIVYGRVGKILVP